MRVFVPSSVKSGHTMTARGVYTEEVNALIALDIEMAALLIGHDEMSSLAEAVASAIWNVGPKVGPFSRSFDLDALANIFPLPSSCQKAMTLPLRLLISQPLTRPVDWESSGMGFRHVPL